MSGIKYVLLAGWLLGGVSQLCAEPSFEIANKDKKPIYILLQKLDLSKAIPKLLEKARAEGKNLWDYFKSEDILGPRLVNSGARIHATLDTNSEIRLFIGQSSNVSPENYEFEISFANAQGKTKYITYNPSKSSDKKKWVYPQTGTFMGLSGKTETGYSLNKNISSNNINIKLGR